MREVISALYQRMKNSAALAQLLDTFQGLPAVYTFSPADQASPYIRMTLVTSVEEADAQQAATFQIDIFERQAGEWGSLDTVMQIRDEVVALFDHYQALSGTRNIRTFIDREAPMDDDDGRYRRWSIDIAVRWNRAV